MPLYSPMNNFVENLRKLFKNRVKDGRLAFLGDGTGRVEVPDRKGYVYYRFQIGDSPGIARSGNASFPVYEGAEVYIAIGYNGEPEIVGANYQRLDEAGFDTRTFNQMHQQSKWVYLFQITLGLCTAVATSATNSFLVSIKKHLTYFNNVLTYFETGEEADKIDLEPYKPAVADQHRYAVVWKDAYNNIAEVTTSTAQSLFMPLDITDANEACALRPPDPQIYKVFVLTNPGNSLRQSITEIDARQFLNVPQVHGFPSPVTHRERIHPDRQQLFAGSLVVTGSLEVLGSLVGLGTGDSGSGGGSGGITQLTGDVTAGPGSGSQVATLATVAIAKGGTGQTSKTPAFDALAPGTTKGDLIVYNGTDNVRKAVGANMTELIADSVDSDGVSWNLRPPVQQLRLGVASQIPIGEFFGGAGDTSYVTLTPWLGNAITLYDGTLWRNYNGAPNGYGDISIRLDVGYSGTRTNGSAIITGLADTTQLAVGMSVTGTGIPGSTVINSIDSATQITLNNNATASGTSTLTFKVPVSKVFDVFAFVDSGSVKLQIILWTNDTTRATAIDQTAYTIIKSGDATRRYLGTGLTSSVTAGTIPGIYGSAGRNMALWNAYNRVLMPLDQRDKTDSWAYTSTTIRQARASTDNQFEVVTGLDDISLISIDLTARASVSGATVGIGLDDTTSYNIAQTGMTLIAAAMTGAKHVGRVPLGRHVYSWNEAGTGGNTFLGDNGGTTLQTGMMGFMEA